MSPSVKIAEGGISRPLQGRKLRKSAWGGLQYGRTLDLFADSHVILPSQWLEAKARKPEQILWLMVLVDAAAHIVKGKDLLANKRWINPRSPYKAPIDFDTCCDLAGADPDYVRIRFERAIKTVETRLEHGVERQLDKRRRTPGTGTAALRHPQANVGGRYRQAKAG